MESNMTKIRESISAMLDKFSSGDREGAIASLQDVLTTKVSARLENEKVEVASSLFGVNSSVVEEDVEHLDESTHVVSGVKGSEDGNRFEMRTHAKGEPHEWSSIIKTHQNGKSLKNESGGYTSYKTGKTAYIKKHFDKLEG